MSIYKGNYGQNDVLDSEKNHLSVVLVVDTVCLSDKTLNEVNAGINDMISKISSKSGLKNTVDICIVSCNDVPEVRTEFRAVSCCGKVTLKSGNRSLLWDGLMIAYDQTDNRKKLYSESGTDSKKPWIIVFSCSEPDSYKMYEAKVKIRVHTNDVLLWGIGCGSYNKNVLKNISYPGCCGEIKNDRISDFFKWTAETLISVAETSPSRKEAKAAVPEMIEFF